MNTPSCTAPQSGFSGASYTVSSDQRGTVRLVATSVISAFVEQMDSGTGQSILTRDVQQATEAQTFGLELSKHDNTENAICLLDNKAKLTTTNQQEKAEGSLPTSDNSHRSDRSNPMNEPPILAACRYNRIDWLQELLAEDPALAYRAAASGVRGESWVYPLCVAAREGHKKAVEQLLKAVDGLVQTKRSTAVKKLLNATDDDGLTPLHLAAKEGNIESLVMMLLTASGILDNKDGGCGWTPLQHAALCGHVEAVI